MSATFEVIGDSSNREEWLKARELGIGASEMAAVMNSSRFDSAISVYARKLKVLTEESSTPPSEAAYWGLRLEKLVAEEFTIRTGIPHEWFGLLIRSKTHPWALATLDARANGEPLECKTANQFLLSEWAEGAPLAYQIQAHQQMLVTGAERCRVACLIGGQRFVWTEVERDETLIRKIVHHGAEFWQRVVERRPPEPDGSDSSFRALNALYDSHQGSVELPGELIAFDHEREALALEKSKIEKRLKALDARFQAEIGNAEQGVLANGVAYRLLKIHRRAFQVAETTYTKIQRKELKAQA